jgi:hypothetical protein
MNYISEIIDIFNFITDKGKNIGWIFTAGSVFVAAWSLMKNQQWNRKHYSCKLGDIWNSQALKHREVIDNKYKCFQSNLLKLESPINIEEALKIHLSIESTDEYWNIKYHIIHLLNFLEDIAIAYSLKVADKKVIKLSYKTSMIRWYEILKVYICIFRFITNSEAWMPFTDLIYRWDKNRNFEEYYFEFLKNRTNVLNRINELKAENQIAIGVDNKMIT